MMITLTRPTGRNTRPYRLDTVNWGIVDGKETACVPSSDGKRSYYLHTDRAHCIVYDCTCPDYTGEVDGVPTFQSKGVQGLFCKHMKALARLMRKEMRYKKLGREFPNLQGSDLEDIETRFEELSQRRKA